MFLVSQQRAHRLHWEEFDDVYSFSNGHSLNACQRSFPGSGSARPRPRLCLLGVSEDLAPLRETRSCHFGQEMASQGEVHFTVNLGVRARWEEGGKEERIEESSKGGIKREMKKGEEDHEGSEGGKDDEGFNVDTCSRPLSSICCYTHLLPHVICT